jgi:hypothetical protein
MPRSKVSFDTVRKLALALPGVEEGTTYGTPAFKIRGQLLTCRAIHKSAEPDSLVIPVDFEQRAELIESDPDVYYLKDHYQNHPVVLVRMSRIKPAALKDLLGMSWRFVSSRTRKRWDKPPRR